MKIGVYFCKCGTNISDRIDPQKVMEEITKLKDVAYFETVDFLCAEEGKEFLEKDLKKKKPMRVVIGACSPRDHEKTFMNVLSKAAINPYLMQMVNIREHVAWVISDICKASDKASAYLKGAVARVQLHEPLKPEELNVCPDVLVIGAGPAGLKASLSLTEAGRKVVLVEKNPVIGGMPVRYEEIFPNMECGPCMLEPMLGDVLHGDNSENIELLTLSEVVEVAGYLGNFIVKIKQLPRYVNPEKCIGCRECIEPCPVSAKNEFNCSLDERKAISFAFSGGLPNFPFIDDEVCLRTKGENCRLCEDACIVDDAINFDDKKKVIERNVGAIIVAVGAELYDCSNLTNLGYGKLPNIYTSLEFERIIASNGPTEGEIQGFGKNGPRSIAIIHCAGSLDKNHIKYCSGTCCQSAFKFNQFISKKLPNTKIFHFFKEISVPGKETFQLYNKALNNPDSLFIRYRNINEIDVSIENGRLAIHYSFSSGKRCKSTADMIILCPPIIPSSDTAELGSILEIPADRYGFFEELHNRVDSVQSKLKGVYLTGSCQSPMDIQNAMNQGLAASGYILSGLPEGKKLEIEPIIASVDEERCSGCRVCILVCPYKAIDFDEEKAKATTNSVLCQGCGTCVAACPAGVIKGNHFTAEELLAEIQGVLT